jgi:hypothetical protein
MERTDMECSENVLLLSRLLDDDLPPSEAEELVRHLSTCSRCRKELVALQRIRFGFEILQDVQAAPWPDESFLEKAMQRITRDSADPRHAEAPAAPRTATAGARRSWRWPAALVTFREKGRAAAGALRPLRYAVPLVLLAILVLWVMVSRETGTIDVASITPAREPVGALVPSSKTSFDEYVFSHATQQPFGRIGDELPLIQEANDSR